MDYEKLALEYHAKKPRGKIAIKLTKPLDSRDDLSVAYSPGVAGPCRVIAENQDDSFAYTGRANLVAVISNGSAVLGLGNIGPYASKPVMEGKAMLFKKFANIDVFDIEVDDDGDVEKFIQTVKSLEPTFGGINLEDIKAPQCFEIEERLREEMNIPVFHDDQHGTAIIAASAFVNALELTKRKISKAKVVFNGAGAAAIACAKLFLTLGVKKENLIMCDSKGVIRDSRDDLNKYKKQFSRDTKLETLEEALKDADAFVGVSVGGALKPEMLKGMAKNPIVFALANPTPEIMPDLAKEARSDVIIATGRSDFPNQVNNVLGFPYIFRGALDVRATTINEEMKLAAVYAIAELAKEKVTDEVMDVYKGDNPYKFGRDYLIPKPVDTRVLLRVAPAVAKAAMKSGVARRDIDVSKYGEKIENILGPNRRLIHNLREGIRKHLRKGGHMPHLVIPTGDNPKIISAVRHIADKGQIKISMLGNRSIIEAKSKELGLTEFGPCVDIIDPSEDEKREEMKTLLYDLRGRKGVSRTSAERLALNDHYYASLLLKSGRVDAVVGGVVDSYKNCVKPLMEVIGGKGKCVAGVYMIIKDNQMTFFADCTMHIDPNSEQLAEIAMATAEIAKRYTKEKIRVALLANASYGSNPVGDNLKAARATQIVKDRMPDLEIDGEMQADVALDEEFRQSEFPFSTLTGRANVLVFPNLSAANISYKLLMKLGGAATIGPIIAGMSKPAHILQRSASTREIIDMIYVTAHEVVSSK
jgi:malate dehydrogenase (oxaloacetate-decarboxylating)(NADP+)